MGEQLVRNTKSQASESFSESPWVICMHDASEKHVSPFSVLTL